MTTQDESRPATLSELQLVRDQLNSRIDDLRNDMNSRMDDLRNELNSRIDDLQKVMFWGFGLLAALLIALLGVVLSGAG